MNTRVIALAVSLLFPLSAACTVADAPDEETGSDGDSAEDGEEQTGTVQQAAVESCTRRNKSQFQQCWSKYCPSGYYAKSCTTTTVYCCRPN